MIISRRYQDFLRRVCAEPEGSRPRCYEAFIFAVLLIAVPARAQETKVVKFATLAPEGSTWMKVMSELSKDLEKETGGKLKFKFYPGGVAGDEKDVVKKIRIGQLQAAGFTGVGLGEIAPPVRLLDAPWLFRSRAELRHVREKFGSKLEDAVEKGGFVVLGWTDLGSIYIFSRSPIADIADMRRSRMWVWEGDQVAASAYSALGISPVPLSVVDVMQSLQTGMIDAVYGPPLGVIALQWFQRTKNIYPVPMAESTGAVLISKKFFDGIPADGRRTLLSLAGKHLQRLNDLTDAENDKALASLKQQGLTMSPAPGAEVYRRYEELGRAARRRLVGRLFEAGLLDEVDKELEAFRARKSQKS